MHVSVNGVRLFFDVEGAKFVPDGPVMREKPVLLMLHGGPGFDHSIYRPAYSALADIAQIVYLDHRGNGRSENGPREAWNLAQWGDDVQAFCEVLGIADPIVLGASFGGMVALAYATRHPSHPSKLILISTAAAGDEYLERRVELFERFGGPEVGALARRRLLQERGHPDQASVEAWVRLAMPQYTHVPRNPDMGRRAINRHSRSADTASPAPKSRRSANHPGEGIGKHQHRRAGPFYDQDSPRQAAGPTKCFADPGAPGRLVRIHTLLLLASAARPHIRPELVHEAHGGGLILPVA